MNIQTVLNRLMCRCAEKTLWSMKLLDLVVSIIFSVIMTELVVKCAIEFG
jgi:hypothetical protein